MRCEQFNQRLHWLLDERRVPEEDQALVNHASECEECRSILEAQRCLFASLTPRSKEVVKARSWKSWSAATAVAAALLVMLLSKPISNHSAAPTFGEQPPLQETVAETPNADLFAEFIKYLPDEPKIADAIWLDGMSGSIRPLADSMTSTFNVLKRGWVGTGREQPAPEPQASRLSAIALS